MGRRGTEGLAKGMGYDIRSILRDIGGTLTDDGKETTPRTREALPTCREKSVALVPARRIPCLDGGLSSRCGSSF